MKTEPKKPITTEPVVKGQTKFRLASKPFEGFYVRKPDVQIPGRPNKIARTPYLAVREECDADAFFEYGPDSPIKGGADEVRRILSAAGYKFVEIPYQPKS